MRNHQFPSKRSSAGSGSPDGLLSTLPPHCLLYWQVSCDSGTQGDFHSIYVLSLLREQDTLGSEDDIGRQTFPSRLHRNLAEGPGARSQDRALQAQKRELQSKLKSLLEFDD